MNNVGEINWVEIIWDQRPACASVLSKFEEQTHGTLREQGLITTIGAFGLED